MHVNNCLASCCLAALLSVLKQNFPPSHLPTTNTAEYLTYSTRDESACSHAKKSKWQSTFIVPVVSVVIYCLLTGCFSAISALISQITSPTLCWENVIVLFVPSTGHRSLRGILQYFSIQRHLVPISGQERSKGNWQHVIYDINLY